MRWSKPSRCSLKVPVGFILSGEEDATSQDSVTAIGATPAPGITKSCPTVRLSDSGIVFAPTIMGNSPASP